MIGLLARLIGLILAPFRIILTSALRVAGLFLGLAIVVAIVWLVLTQC